MRLISPNYHLVLVGVRMWKHPIESLWRISLFSPLRALGASVSKSEPRHIVSANIHPLGTT